MQKEVRMIKKLLGPAIKMLVFPFCLTAVGSELSSGIIYQNDFAVRGSANSIQTGDWYEWLYAKGRPLVKNISGVYDVGAPWNAGNWESSQDNWRKLALSDSVDFSCVCGDDDGNQYGEVSSGSSATQKKTGIIQPFYNSITDGVLRIRCDFRSPAKWPSGNGYVRVQPLARKHLTNMDFNATGTLYNFGIQRNSNGSGESSKTRAIAYYANNSVGGSGAAAMSNDEWDGGRWCRVVSELDLSSGRVTFRAYDLGTTHPAVDQSGGAEKAWNNSDTHYLVTAMCEANGPIEGIAVAFNEFSSVATIGFDNLVCEWKKPGASEFARFYENDFSTRRYRSLSPAGTTSFEYATKATPYSKTSADYGNYVIPRWWIDDANAVQPLGFDGWRRVNKDGHGNMNVLDAQEDGGNRVVVSGANTFVNAAHPLGRDITSGKLKLQADFRTPDRWYFSGITPYVAVGLGGNILYKGTKNQQQGSYGAYIACRVGASSTSSSDKTAFRPAWLDANGSSAIDSGKSLSASTWYRAIVTVDKDSNVYGFKLYKLGSTSKTLGYDAPAQSELVYEKTGLPLWMTDAISSFAIWTYGAGDTAAGNILVDNVRAWANDESTAFYTFHGRASERVLTLQRGTVIGEVPQVDHGQDHWIRRNNGAGSVFVTAGANPCLAADAQGTFAIALQPLGTSVRHGKLKMTVDIRPPKCWTWDAEGLVSVNLGGDRYLQGVMGTNDHYRTAFTASHGPRFGFGRSSAAAWDECGNRTDVKMTYFRGNGDGTGSDVVTTVPVDTAHWYRFKATVDIDAHTYDLVAYDMGTSHPTASTVAGTQVLPTVRDIPFRYDDSDISALAVAAYGVSQIEPQAADDAGLVLVDNIVVKEMGGLEIIVR